MKKYRIVVFILLLLAIAGSALALPEYSTYTEYFNSSGQQIGWRIWNCWGGTTGSGGYSDIYTQEATDCETSETVSCDELGLEQIPGCPICVSGEYKDLYDLNIVPNPCA